MKTQLRVLAATPALALGPAIHAADEKPADKKDDAKCADGEDGGKGETGKDQCGE